MPFLDKTGLSHLWSKIIIALGKKVDKKEMEQYVTNQITSALGAIENALAEI